MKMMRIPLVFAGWVLAATLVSGQTITEFIIAKTNDHYQTIDGSTSSGNINDTGNTKAYGIVAQVTGTSLSGTYSFTRLVSRNVYSFG